MPPHFRDCGIVYVCMCVQGLWEWGGQVELGEGLWLCGRWLRAGGPREGCPLGTTQGTTGYLATSQGQAGRERVWAGLAPFGR